jgi:hypothetical protein
MTQEELTTIVQQVVAALLTNGKTIAQLTAVTSVGDNDCFELSGGKKVAYSTLAGLIINEVGSLVNYQVVDYDDRDEVVTFTYTKSSGVITMKQDGRTAKTITIATATTSRPGLMSAADKTSLNTAVNKVLSGLSYSGRVITATFADNTTTTLTIPEATPTAAGLMSAADKLDLATAKNLAVALNNKLGAASGIATLDSNGKLNEAQLPSNVITSLDMYSFADLDASGFVKSELMQRNVIFNISGSADLSGLQHGDIFFQEGTLFWYDYTNNHGSRICSPVGDPQENTIYCLKGTGLFYRWDSTNSCFVPVNPQVMVSMGSTLDNAGNNGNTQVYVTLNAGDIYFDPSTSKIYYKKSSSVDIDLGAPSKLLIYANKQSNKLYRWSGSQMVELG